MGPFSISRLGTILLDMDLLLLSLNKSKYIVSLNQNSQFTINFFTYFDKICTLVLTLHFPAQQEICPMKERTKTP